MPHGRLRRVGACAVRRVPGTEPALTRAVQDRPAQPALANFQTNGVPLCPSPAQWTSTDFVPAGIM